MKRNYPVIDAIAAKLQKETTYHLLFEHGDEFLEEMQDRVVIQDLASPQRCAQEYRDYIERLDLGASQVSFGKVVRADNRRLVATISYNEKIDYES